jgi:hypothetical protein
MIGWSKMNERLHGMTPQWDVSVSPSKSVNKKKHQTSNFNYIEIIMN